jgi:hypothetical protein
MPPLLCPSPVILDQSFPRDDHELKTVAIALGVIQHFISENRIHVVLTFVLGQVIQNFNWNRGPQVVPLLMEIFRLLTQWFLQPHEGLVKFDVLAVKNYNPHPLPIGLSDEGLSIFWADEVGKLLVLHDVSVGHQGFCIGVACERAFCGKEPNSYNNPHGLRCFPMVGPNQLGDLQDAYEWGGIPAEVHSRKVALSDVNRNYRLLGASGIEPPQRGSHYKVLFPGNRSWTLTQNIDPIPDSFLRELVPITNLPLLVIKTVLLYGFLPKKNVLRVRRTLGD